MPTVRDATFELFRRHGMTTIFGNPGSTELPMLDWRREIEPVDYVTQIARASDGRAQPAPARIAALAERIRSASRPVFVAGPDVDASAGGWDAAIELVESQRLPVWAAPPTN